MLCSLNEVEVMVRRSCRGVGLVWGLAYEAGYAVRCLASGGVDFLSPLLFYLSVVDGGEPCSFAPASLEGGTLCARGNKGGTGMCPIMAGCVLSDGGVDVYGARVVLRDVLSPVLLLGFLSRGVERWGGSVVVRWGGVGIRIDGGGFVVEGEVGGLGDERCDVVVDGVGEVVGTMKYGVGEVVMGVEVGEGDWRRLGCYAARTYVVASESSRARGAGYRGGQGERGRGVGV